MDSFELNKIMGAVLGTLLFVMGVGFVAEELYHPTATGPGYELPEGTEGGGDAGGGDEAPAVSIATLLASADATQGADQAKKCMACHDFSEANANKAGPGLYDVVERVIGSHPGFAYSAVLTEHHDKGDTWTYDNLNHFLTSPKAFAPGTKMTFAGVKNDQERANIIAFLSTLSASPKPFPAPEAAAPADEGAAPAEEPAAQADEPAASSEEPAAASEEPAQPSAEPAVSEVPAAEAIETPSGVDTGASESPAGATAETPAGGGDAAVSSEAQSAVEPATSSEASSAAQ